MIFLKWLFSSRYYELKIVFATLTVLFTLPLIGIVVLVSAPTSALGSVLAALNPVTHDVQIFDTNGNEVTTLSVTTVWPTRGYVSDEFGTLDSSRYKLGLGRHTGIDIANRSRLIGEPVTTFIDGTVRTVDALGLGTCGKNILVQHDFNLTSRYCHLSVVNIIAGQSVKQGDTIGLMGSTGVSSGPHLHFMVMVYDIPVNPRTFMVGEPAESTVRNAIPAF